ncbi:hypothetical protein Btru_029316 [Bulinus truncatus]|nr:hypothetical protein Btru_029316 [Bulinus truncatus]
MVTVADRVMVRKRKSSVAVETPAFIGLKLVTIFTSKKGANTNGTLGRGVPLLVFGCLIALAGGLLFFLPETLNRKLPETINDAKNFTRPQPDSPEKESKGDIEKCFTEDMIKIYRM